MEEPGRGMRFRRATQKSGWRFAVSNSVAGDDNARIRLAALGRGGPMVRGKNVSLRDSIQKRRERSKTREVFEPDAFTCVAAILEAFGLSGETFLRLLDEEPVSRTVARALAREGPRKTVVSLPLFALVDPPEFPPLETILSRVQCPYLRWAASPEDVLLSRPLYALHPSIPPRRLKRYSYAFLYRYYAAKKRAPEASHG